LVERICQPWEQIFLLNFIHIKTWLPKKEAQRGLSHSSYGDAVIKSLERQHSLYCVSTHHMQCTSVHCMLELLIEVYV